MFLLCYCRLLQIMRLLIFNIAIVLHLKSFFPSMSVKISITFTFYSITLSTEIHSYIMLTYTCNFTPSHPTLLAVYIIFVIFLKT